MASNDDSDRKKKKQQQDSVPMSLNQRHSRFIQDISSSESKPRPPPTPFSFSLLSPDENDAASSTEKVEEGRRYQCTDISSREDEVPNFAKIADFDSPLDATNSCQLNDQPLSPGRSGEVVDNNTSAASSDHKEKEEMEQEEKVTKVKIAGRRRLCKMASKSDDSVDQRNTAVDQLSDITDFSSPIPVKTTNSEANDIAGGDEIRDILADLSARLEYLSIEKRPTANKIAKPEVVPIHEELGGYASADSSFSNCSGHSGSSPDKRNLNNLEPEGDDKAGKDHHSESDEEGFVAGREFDTGEVSKTENKVSDKPRRYVLDDSDEDEKENDRVSLVDVKLPGKKQIDHQSRRDHHSESDEESYVAGREFETGEVSKTQNKDSDKPRGYVLDGTDEDDKENGCVSVADENLPGKKQIDHQSKRYDKRAVEILDDEEAVKFVPEEDHSITLKGLRETYKLPSRIGKMLYPHQREGLKWLWSLHCVGKGGILGDDMGLGKTMQICGYLAGLFHSRLTKRIMVVAPKTLIPHWIKELTVVGLSHKIKEYYGTCLKARQYELKYVLQNDGILLTTYDIVRNNCKRLCDNSFQDDEDEPLWDYMILDEGHLIKNPSTQRAKSLLEIPCVHRIIISGTPLQNNLKELWALFNFCCPGLLGDKKWFKEHYENCILRGNEKRATERDKLVGSTIAKKLREHIQPYFLRRMKSEVFSEANNKEGSATLSNKNEIIIWLKLTQCQRRLYEAFLKSELVLGACDGSPLAAITILKKICDHPYLLTKRAAEDVLDGLDDSMTNVEDRDMAENLAKRFAEYTEDEFEEKQKQDKVSCKISFILQLLENLIPEGHSVLIFSQTRKMLNIIQELLETNGYDFLRIDGTTKAIDRLKIVNEFQEGHGASIFMLTSQVGGLGLTLTRADRVIVVDPAWNPSTDNQSVDRAYRIGQKKDVLVYRLMTCGTIEEKIYRKQIFKGGLFKTATEKKEQTRYFSQQDLKELLRLPKDGFDISPTQQQLHEEHSDQIALNDTLKEHIKFLESIGIGGVSHHSLLYSKTERAPTAQEEEMIRMETGNCDFSYRYPPARVQERAVDGSDFAKFAVNPKDVVKAKPSEMRSSPGSSSKLTESDIKERISRLSQLLSNKSTVSKLPDGGKKIQKQIEDLNVELDNIRTPPKQGTKVIDLEDDVADELQRTLNISS